MKIRFEFIRLIRNIPLSDSLYLSHENLVICSFQNLTELVWIMNSIIRVKQTWVYFMI